MAHFETGEDPPLQAMFWIVTLVWYIFVFMYFREADENREKENQAATQIQSWFRGCKVRAYLRYGISLWSDLYL